MHLANARSSISILITMPFLEIANPMLQTSSESAMGTPAEQPGFPQVLASGMVSGWVFANLNGFEVTLGDHISWNPASISKPP